MDATSNDNDVRAYALDGVVPEECDAHGQAAILLVESLLHRLVAQSILSVADAVEVVDIASNVSEEIGRELGGPPAKLQRSMKILESIRDSLAIDLPNA